MDKAIKKIEWLQDVFVTRKEEQHFEVYATIKNSFAEAIVELQAYKAKMEDLKEHYKAALAKENEEWVSNSKMEAYKDILQKLEELDK